MVIEEEKQAIKKLAAQYITNHEYFGVVWVKHEIAKKSRLLDTIAGGKGIFPHKKIISSDFLDIKPSGEFFGRTEFFRVLKQQNVSKGDYEIFHYLWKTLRMRNLSDMSDLYNAQHVILLCEIIENRFQLMQVNMASTLENAILQVL